MRLRKATGFTIVGICYLFVSRTAGTFFPAIFRNLAAAQISAVLSFLAILTVLFFYYTFYKDYVHKEQTELRNASLLAIIASAALLLLELKGLVLVFNLDFISFLFRSPQSAALAPVMPWVSALFFLLFFVAFRKITRTAQEARLKKAILWGIIGASISLLMRTLILVMYLYSGKIRWLSDFPGKVALLFLPITVFGFATGLYFYATFYRIQVGRT